MTKAKDSSKNKSDLQIVYRLKGSIQFDALGENENIRIIKVQNHWSQRILRKLRVKIPQKTYKELDKYGSFLFREIDGVKTVEELGQKLSVKFDEARNQLFERLVPYLQHLEQNEKWIEQVKTDENKK